MKFKLSRQVINEDVNKIISREMKKQKISFSLASKKQLREIAAISEVIKKEGLPKHLVRKKLPHGLGYGLFLHPDSEPILKGEVIAPYAGKTSIVPQNDDPEDGSYAFAPLENIRLSREEQAHFHKKGRYHPGRNYAFKVDALKEGNFTRFINHSDKPNVVAQILTVPSNSFGVPKAPIEVIYIAKKTIRPGEQLLVCYEDGEKSYWSVSGIKPFPVTPTTFKLTHQGTIQTQTD